MHQPSLLLLGFTSITYMQTSSFKICHSIELCCEQSLEAKYFAQDDTYRTTVTVLFWVYHLLSVPLARMVIK